MTLGNRQHNCHVGHNIHDAIVNIDTDKHKGMDKETNNKDMDKDAGEHTDTVMDTDLEFEF
jgi:hypothetical protein